MLNHLKCSSCFNGFSQPDDGEGPSKHVCFPIARAHSLSYDLWQKNFHLSVSRVIAKSRTLKWLKFNHRREVWWVVFAALLLAFALIDLCSRHWRTHPPKKKQRRERTELLNDSAGISTITRDGLCFHERRERRGRLKCSLLIVIFIFITLFKLFHPRNRISCRATIKSRSQHAELSFFLRVDVAKGGVIQTSSVIRGISRCSFWICTVHRDEIK